MAGHDKTTAAGEKFLKELQELSQMQVRVGFQRGKKHKGKGEVFEQKALGQKLALPACFAHIYLFCCRRIDHFALPVIWSTRS